MLLLNHFEKLWWITFCKVVEVRELLYEGLWIKHGVPCSCHVFLAPFGGFKSLEANETRPSDRDLLLQLFYQLHSSLIHQVLFEWYHERVFCVHVFE